MCTARTDKVTVQLTDAEGLKPAVVEVRPPLRSSLDCHISLTRTNCGQAIKKAGFEVVE